MAKRVLYKPYISCFARYKLISVGFFLDRKKIDWNVALSKFFPAGLEKKKINSQSDVIFLSENLGHFMSNLFFNIYWILS